MWLSSVCMAAAADQQVSSQTQLHPATVVQVSEAAPRYSITPGDVLTVSVWKEPDLTGDVTVRLDGQITVPLVGDVEASGRSPRQLSTELEGKLGLFVEAPKVTVAVAQANRRFFVIGQVNSSGAYPLGRRVTVLQALALAAGFTTFAKRDRILIVSRSRRQAEVHSGELREAVLPRSMTADTAVSAHQIGVSPYDI
jgi:polysaccharide export outer membrane protein